MGFEGSTPRKERKDFPDCSGAIFHVRAWICEFCYVVGRSCFEEIYTENDIECWSGYCSSLVHTALDEGQGWGGPSCGPISGDVGPLFYSADLMLI